MRLTVLLLSWLAFAPGVASAALVDRIAAVVDKEVIALSEIYELGESYITEKCPTQRVRCVRERELEVLETLILRVLVRKELRDLDLDVTSDETDRAIAQIARENNIESPERLRLEVEASGLRWEVYREQLTEQIRQMKFQEAVIRPRITVSQDELVDQYRRSARDLSAPATVTVQAITLKVAPDAGESGLVEAITFAHALRQRVLDGELTWADAVTQHHSGQFTGPDGMLPPVKEGDLMPALDKAVFGAQEGEIPEPVLAASTIFLVKILKRTASGVLPLEEVQDQLREQIYAQKSEEQVEQWYVQARKRTSVKVLLEPAETL